MTTICKDCGQEIHHGDYPFCPHESTLSLNAQRFSPVVIFRNADGHVRLPGSTDIAPPAGFERVELKTVHEVRKFEREMNQREHAKHEDSRYRDSQACEAARTKLRGELRMAMQQMSPLGRDFARYAIEQTNNRRKGRYDAGFRVEALS